MAEGFAYDGTILKKVKIDYSDILYSSYFSLSGTSLYGLTLEFDSGLDIQSNDGCFVNYNFPASLGISETVIETIKATNMFVDADGNE